MSPVNMSLDGKIAVVTGAASGIGAATVHALSQAGRRSSELTFR